MKTYKWIFTISIALLILSSLLSACKPKVQIENKAQLEAAFQAALDKMVNDNKNNHSAVIMIQGPGVEWQGASGYADPDAGIEMLPGDQYRSASTAKMTLTVLALRLAEEGYLDLDAPIADYLPNEIITGLHVYEGTDYSDTITTRQLLHNTSGIADFWFDERDEDRFITMVLEEDTDHLWQPIETVNYAKENLTPLSVPGEEVHYSDTNFILAGLVIESVTGQPLHEVYRQWLFEPLGMEHTYMEFREPSRESLPGRGISHVFYGDIDYTNFQSISADWAGGGLVTTTEDMTRFMRAFADNAIFTDPTTQDAMSDWMPFSGDNVEYGLGLMRITGKTITLIGHLGVGQAFIFYWPDGDVTLCGTLNQNEVQVGGMVSEMIIAMRSYTENQP